MTASFIALLSVFAGIIGANLLGLFFKKYTLGLIGTTISGVFGSVFFTKSFGRLGFSPNFILVHQQFNNKLFITNLIVSLIGGSIGLLFAFWMQQKMNKPS